MDRTFEQIWIKTKRLGGPPKDKWVIGYYNEQKAIVIVMRCASSFLIAGINDGWKFFSEPPDYWVNFPYPFPPDFHPEDMEEVETEGIDSRAEKFDRFEIMDFEK